MFNLCKILFLINQVRNINNQTIEHIKQPNTKVISFNLLSHKLLDSLRIPHEIADNFLDEDERNELFEYTTSCYEWYKKIQIPEKIEYHGINILCLLNTFEFHQFLLATLIKVFTIKKILEKEPAQKIIISRDLSKYFKIFQNLKFDLEFLNSDLVSDTTTDQIQLYINFLRKPISFSLSIQKLSKIKKFYENILCKIFNLWYKPTSKPVILLVEFDPTSYQKLLFELGKLEFDVVLFNNRKSALWNLESIKTVKNSNSKLLNIEKFLDSKLKNEIISTTEQIQNILNQIWESNSISKFFTKNDLSFWDCIKDQFVFWYNERLENFIKMIALFAKAFDVINVKSLMLLYQIGETEKIIFQTQKPSTKSFLLQHSFSIYDAETSPIRWKYDDLNLIPPQTDKIFLWGQTDLVHYSSKKEIPREKLVVTGSPRHDSFFSKTYNKKNSNSFKILLAPQPITDFGGINTINLSLKYETLLLKIFSIVKNLTNVELFVKLHPGWGNPHNRLLFEFIKNTDSTIPIYQINAVDELLNSCDLLLNISTEPYYRSTIMIEGLIFKKPVMEVILFDQKQSKESQAILQSSYQDDLEYHLKKIITDNKFRESLVQKGQKKLQEFLTNPGTASEVISKVINSS